MLSVPPALRLYCFRNIKPSYCTGEWNISALWLFCSPLRYLHYFICRILLHPRIGIGLVILHTFIFPRISEEIWSCLTLTITSFIFKAISIPYNLTRENQYTGNKLIMHFDTLHIFYILKICFQFTRSQGLNNMRSNYHKRTLE